MRIVVDGLPLLGQASIGTYLRQLLLHLAAADGQHEYHLFFRGFREADRFSWPEAAHQALKIFAALQEKRLEV